MATFCETRMSFIDGFSGLSLHTLLIAAMVFVLAGLVKGVVGLGLPLVAMGLLAIVMPPAQAAALLIVPSLFTNIWQAGPLRSLAPLLRRIGPMQVGVCVGTLGGAFLFGAPAGAWASGLLGVALIAYAVWGLFGHAPVLAARAEKWLGPVVGVSTGVVTAVTGVFSVPAVPYLQALNLGKDGLVQAMGVSFTVSTIVLGIGLWFNGSYTPHAAGASVLMLLPALLGMVVGSWLRRSLSPGVFRLCLLCSLALLGVYQVINAFLS